MRDALDARELTRLDLRDLERRYGFPYMVIHRSDLHGIFLRACQRAGVELLTGQLVLDYQNTDTGARVRLADGRVDEAALVIAADGLHSAARQQLVGDTPVNSAYVAYRGAVPIDRVRRERRRRDRRRRLHRATLPLRAVPAARRRDVQPGRRVRVGQGPGRPGGLGHAGRA